MDAARLFGRGVDSAAAVGVGERVRSPDMVIGRQLLQYVTVSSGHPLSLPPPNSRPLPLADHDLVLHHVLHQRVLNCDHLDECLQEAAAVLADDSDGPFRVLIVDSIIALYRQEFPGRGELSERQQHIGKVMQDLKSLSEVFNLAVILSKR